MNYTLLKTFSGESGGSELYYSVWDSDTFRVRFTSDSSIVSTGFRMFFELGIHLDSLFIRAIIEIFRLLFDIQIDRFSDIEL